jgi:two-component system cell cycle sensor histidine kinase/response regulator CckA
MRGLEPETIDEPLRVLCVEDSTDDAALIERELRRARQDVVFERVEDAASMRAALERAVWDVVLSDWSLPHFCALDALGVLRERHLDIPFIVISGTVTEEVAVAAMRTGAQDYVLKGRLTRLIPAIDRELRARKNKEASDRESAATYDALFNESPIAMWCIDRETLAFSEVNESALRLYGYSRREFVSMTLEDIEAPPGAPGSGRGTDDEPQSRWSGLRSHRRKDGSSIAVRMTTAPLRFRAARECLCVVEDVTQKQILEAQLRQAQKMEAVGRLAGGVAHDFNNMLSVILSYADLLLGDLGPDSAIRGDLLDIRTAAERAADLTRQLLTFSRKQVIEPKVVDLNELLSSTNKMLKRIIGEDIDLVVLAKATPGRVRIDAGAIEQVVMNLVVNARDAMPKGGKLTIETRNVILDESYVRLHAGVTAGPYVMLAVTDTGTGMDPATQARIFEPFFTTKRVGKGTGLGLATVFGTVEQSGGSVWVYSEVGLGTTFKVYLPRVDDVVEPASKRVELVRARATETILLVEDEEQVRAVARGILTRLGYEILDAADPNEALRLSAAHTGDIHLLLSDVVMPQMSGPILAEQVRALRPDIEVLYMSGYTDDSIVRHGILEANVAFIQKPITPRTLAQKVREVLDGRAVEKERLDKSPLHI